MSSRGRALRLGPGKLYSGDRFICPADGLEAHVSSWVAFSLPWPPTVGMYWRAPNKGPLAGRFLLSEKGRAYRHAAFSELARQGVPRLNRAGSLSVEVLLQPPDRRRRDLDNYPKALLDVLKPRQVRGVDLAGVIEDDSYIDRLLVLRGPIVPGGAVLIVIEDLEP